MLLAEINHLLLVVISQSPVLAAFLYIEHVRDGGKVLWFLAIAPTEAGRSRTQIKETDTSLPSRHSPGQSSPYSSILEVAGTKGFMVGQNSSLYRPVVRIDCVCFNIHEHLGAQTRNCGLGGFCGPQAD